MSKQNSLRRVLFAVFILFLVTAIGVVGFMYFENDNFLDALYMTTITITTFYQLCLCHFYYYYLFGRRKNT